MSPAANSSSFWLMRWLPFLALCAVILHHLWFVSSHAINIPYQDDIYDFLRVMNQVESAETPGDALKVWLAQYNDHRTIASRLMVYGAYLIEGAVNFRTLTLLANLGLPLLLVVFYIRVRSDQYRWLFLLVSALLLLSLRFYSIGLSSQPAFAYFYVVLYTFACLFALHRISWLKLGAAAIFCTLATFTFASGQIVWLLGFAGLLHQYWLGERRSPRYAVAWLLLAVVVLTVWRIGFVDAPQDIPLASFPDQLVEPPAPVQQVLTRYMAWFLVILGCAFIDFSTFWAGVAGLFMLAALLWMTFRSLQQDDLRLVLCGWFVVANAAAVSIGRAMLLSPHYILHERYSFFSVLLLCVLVLLFQLRLQASRAPVAYLAVLLAALYWTWTYRQFESSLQEMQSNRYAEFNRGRHWIVGKSFDESNAIVEQAIATGLYRPPCRPFPACEKGR